MPIYTYKFTGGPEVGESIEIMQGINEPHLTHDPGTGEPIKRIVTPPTIFGRYADHTMRQVVNDNRLLGQLGFTKFEKRSDGTYERTAGVEGPRHIDPKSFPADGL